MSSKSEIEEWIDENTIREVNTPTLANQHHTLTTTLANRKRKRRWLCMGLLGVVVFAELAVCAAKVLWFNSDETEKAEPSSSQDTTRVAQDTTKTSTAEPLPTPSPISIVLPTAPAPRPAGTPITLPTTPAPRPDPNPIESPTSPTQRPVTEIVPPKVVELEGYVRSSKAPNEAIRQKAAVGLASFLTDSDVLLRRKASQALATMGAAGEPALDSLKLATKDPDPEVRKFAEQSLNELEEIATLRKAGDLRKAILALAVDLKAPEPEDRIKALYKIAAFGPDANIICENVIEAMRDKVGAVETVASDTLAKINPKIHPHIVTIFRGKSKREAITALGELGVEAHAALPLLLYCNENTAFWGGGKATPIRPTVITPGGTITPSELGNSYEDLFPTIAKIAPSDKRFASAVLTFISTPNPKRERALRERRLAGIAQLKVIEAKTEDKVAALIAAVDDGEAVVQVIKTLEEFGGDAKPALPTLKKLKLSTNKTVSNAAITAIAKIE